MYHNRCFSFPRQNAYVSSAPWMQNQDLRHSFVSRKVRTGLHGRQLMFFWLQSLRLIVEVQFCHHSGFKRTLVFVLKRIQRMEMSLMLWLIFMCIHWVMVCTRLIKAYQLPGRRHASSYSACRQPTLQENSNYRTRGYVEVSEMREKRCLCPPRELLLTCCFQGQ